MIMQFYSLLECPEVFDSAGWYCVSCSQENSGYIEGIFWGANHCEGVMAMQMPGSNIPDIFCGGISLRNCVNQNNPRSIQVKVSLAGWWTLLPSFMTYWKELMHVFITV